MSDITNEGSSEEILERKEVKACLHGCFTLVNVSCKNSKIASDILGSEFFIVLRAWLIIGAGLGLLSAKSLTTSRSPAKAA